jgi:hypothetical protein
MLLLSPMSSKAHFATLVLPGMCLARAAVQTRDRFVWTLLVAAVALGLVSLKGLLGERLYSVSLWLGLVTWQTLILFLACLILLRRLRTSFTQQTLAPNVNEPTPIAA